MLLPGENDVQARHEEGNEQGAVHMTAADKREDMPSQAGNQASQLAQQVGMNHRKGDMGPVLALEAQEDERNIPLGRQELRRKIVEGTAVVDMLEGHTQLRSE